MKRVIFLVVAVAAIMFTSCKKEYTIIVQSNNESWGSVEGSGTYTKRTVISIGAISNKGYQFAKWDDGNSDNPRTITIEKNATYTAVFVEEEPTSTGIFSVSETQKVNFSPGNLQWSATGSHAVAGNGTAAGIWRFAPNQWDMIGAANSNVSSTYTGWIDLFGWGTSGYNNKYPYMVSVEGEDYGNGLNDIAGTNYDWGMYNAIYHPKNQTTDAPGTWRTLTTNEWIYLLKARTTLSGIRYAKATVCGIVGLIIVPDNWSNTYYPLTNVNETYGAAYTSNIIGASDWAKMEAVGCVFLPAAGHRYETSVYAVGSTGYYWSTTYIGCDGAYYLGFDSSRLYPSDFYDRIYSKSVRLVRSAQ